MKIVFLEAGTLGADMDFSPFEKLGEVVRYETSIRRRDLRAGRRR